MIGSDPDTASYLRLDRVMYERYVPGMYIWMEAQACTDKDIRERQVPAQEKRAPTPLGAQARCLDCPFEVKVHAFFHHLLLPLLRLRQGTHAQLPRPPHPSARPGEARRPTDTAFSRVPCPSNQPLDFPCSSLPAAGRPSASCSTAACGGGEGGEEDPGDQARVDASLSPFLQILTIRRLLLLSHLCLSRARTLI